MKQQCEKLIENFSLSISNIKELEKDTACNLYQRFMNYHNLYNGYERNNDIELYSRFEIAIAFINKDFTSLKGKKIKVKRIVDYLLKI